MILTTLVACPLSGLFQVPSRHTISRFGWLAIAIAFLDVAARAAT
jgi:hypothetical protein